MYIKKGAKTTHIIFTALLILILTFSFYQPMETYAANKTLVYEQSKNADILASNKYSIKLNVTADLEINVFVPAPIGVTFTIKNSSGKVVGNPMVLTNYDDSWILDGRGWYTYKYVVNQLKKGSYSVEYVFDQETKFDAKIVQLSNNVSLSSNKLSITKGFVKTLKVNNGVATSWTSSNSSVASVNRKGKITGKKIGTTTVTAHLSDGKSLKCKVTIKANEYSGKKITIEDSGINEYTIRAYHAAYQANGNMVIKFRIANGTNKKITAIPKFHVSVINQKNKGIASYSNNSFKVNVPKHSVKEYSITIKKNSISGGKADLRNTNIEISGERVKL